MSDQKRCPRAATAPACPKKAQPRRRTAIHEAGHALASWWHGQPIYSVTASRASIGENAIGPVDGHVHARRFLADSEQVSAMDSATLRELVGRDLISHLAGPLAEARHCRCSLDEILQRSGAGDEQAAFDLLGFLETDQTDEWLAPMAEAIERARRLLRRYWPAIVALADQLQAHGHLDGANVSALFCRLTGESPELRSNALHTLDAGGARHE